MVNFSILTEDGEPVNINPFGQRTGRVIQLVCSFVLLNYSAGTLSKGVYVYRFTVLSEDGKVYYQTGKFVKE
jgi:methionine-rich copper-binding protein CopC